MTAGLLIALLIAGCISLAAGLALTVSQALAQRQASAPSDSMSVEWLEGPNAASQLAALFSEADTAPRGVDSPSISVLAALSGLAAGLVAFTVANSPWLGVAVAMFVGGVFVAILTSMARQRRQAAFLEQTYTTAVSIQKPVASGVDLLALLRQVAESHGDVGEELAQIARRVTSGVPLDAAVDESVERVGEAEFALLTSGLRLQDEAIDGAPALWDRLGDLLNRRQEVSLKRAALTRRTWVATGVAVALLCALIALTWIFAPHLVSTLVARPSGQVCLGLGLVGFVAALIAMHLAVSRELEL